MFRFLMRKKLHKLQERCLQKKKKSVGEKGEKNNSNSLVTSVT